MMKVFFLGFLLSSLLSLIVGSIAACSTIATYDQNAYEKATGAKGEALTLMDKATGPFSAHETEIEAVSLTIDKTYEYDRSRALNSITIDTFADGVLQILIDTAFAADSLKRLSSKQNL